jgi:hypothetical protein
LSFSLVVHTYAASLVGNLFRTVLLKNNGRPEQLMPAETNYSAFVIPVDSTLLQLRKIETGIVQLEQSSIS